YNWLITAFILSLTLVGFASRHTQAYTMAKLDIPLQQVLSTTSDQMVNVIVQRSHDAHATESIIEQLGGIVYKDLPIINSVAATLNSSSIPVLAQSNVIKHISFDSILQSSTTPAFKMETVFSPSVADAWSSFTLTNTYTSPVIVCTPTYNKSIHTLPFVVRLRNVTSNSFEMRLQNPGNKPLSKSALVHCLVVEEGAWTLPDGRKIEAHTYNSTKTASASVWYKELQSYSQSYT
ncbi:MAG: hypothetical protein KC423_27335, partial [Anaerolineales bacterium]|nr:hypothetical protein [Anaerolineales bacterium]